MNIKTKVLFCRQNFPSSCFRKIYESDILLFSTDFRSLLPEIIKGTRSSRWKIIRTRERRIHVSPPAVSSPPVFSTNNNTDTLMRSRRNYRHSGQKHLTSKSIVRCGLVKYSDATQSDHRPIRNDFKISPLDFAAGFVRSQICAA